jgi:hypothetical protein
VRTRDSELREIEIGHVILVSCEAFPCPTSKKDANNISSHFYKLNGPLLCFVSQAYTSVPPNGL